MFKLRASKGGAVATNPTGKSNAVKHAEAIEKMAELTVRLSEFKNQECKTAIEIKTIKIPETEKLIADLYKVKDVVEISETAKTYAQEWLKESIYGTKKEIKNKYLSKGLRLEDEAIDKAIEWLDIDFTLKNESFFEDDYFTGTPDLFVKDTVYDIKCSWDCFTFPLFETEIPTKDYFYQLQIYMHLTGKTKAVLCYVLLNTPEELTWEPSNNYDAVDKKYKIKTFEFDYDPLVIEDLKQRVLNIREYINNLKY